MCSPDMLGPAVGSVCRGENLQRSTGADLDEQQNQDRLGGLEEAVELWGWLGLQGVAARSRIELHKTRV